MTIREKIKALALEAAAQTPEARQTLELSGGAWSAAYQGRLRLGACDLLNDLTREILEELAASLPSDGSN